MKNFIYDPPKLQLLVINAEKGFANSKDCGYLEEIYGEIEGEW